jgi:hypothetical protein
MMHARWITVALGTTIAIAACANRPANSYGEADRDHGTVQVVERKPMGTPEITLPRETEPTRSQPAVDDSFFACTDSADCVVLETGCCDHCNGGALLAVNTRYSESAMEAFRQNSCADDSACTKVACEWSFTPVCDAGTCARLEERALGKAGATMVVVHNAPMD